MPEEKKEVAKEEVKAEEAVTEVFKYEVSRRSDGKYDFKCVTTDKDGKPLLSTYEIARDIITLAPILEHQLVCEEATQRAVQTIVSLIQNQSKAEEEAKKEETK